MFEQIILLESRSARRRWALAAAFFGELLLVAIVIAIPLLSIQKLPLPEISTVLIAPLPPPPPPPPSGPAAQAHAQAARVPNMPLLRHFDASKLSTPRTIPTTTAMINDLPAAPLAGGVVGGVAGGVPGGQVGGVLGGILGGVPSAAPPPPVQAATPPPKPATPNLLRVGGAVEAARVISAPVPAYPVLAKSANIEGTVRMNAIIGPDGHIENLSVVSGNPLLINAAVDAVKQWTYRPTYLNGQAVKVQTEIDVKFELTS